MTAASTAFRTSSSSSPDDAQDWSERLRKRLGVLQDERNRGEEHLRRLDVQREQLRDLLLRIDGAIQVIEELLAPAAED